MVWCIGFIRTAVCHIGHVHTSRFALNIIAANNSAYYNGVRHGGHGGNYYNDRDRHYHDDHYRDNKGGIGPGKGALIGADGGAVLGALFGGGLKGTIIGGAAGAGVGAVVGQAAQNNRDNHYHHY